MDACMTANLSHGVLEMNPKGFGFLRNPARHYVPQQGDAYVPAPLIGKFRLKEGLLLAGPTESSKKGSGPRLLEVREIEGQPADSPPASWTC
jgi:transcription termination factor Rho